MAASLSIEARGRAVEEAGQGRCSLELVARVLAPARAIVDHRAAYKEDGSLRGRAAVSVIASMAATAAGLYAQQRDPARAEALFVEARTLIKAGNYELACPKLAESQRLDPAAGMLMNLADCEEHVGKLTSARRRWLDLLRVLPATGDARRPHAEQRLADLERRAGRLVVRLADGAPPGAEVSVDGVPLAADRLGQLEIVDPGDHEIVVRAPGRWGHRYPVAIYQNQTKTVVVEPGDPVAPAAAIPVPLPAASSSAAAAPARAAASVQVPGPRWSAAGGGGEPGTPGAGPSDQTVGGILFLSAGAAGMGIGAMLGFIAIQQKRSLDSACHAGACPAEKQSELDAYRSTRSESAIAFWTGLGLAATGVVLVVTAPNRDSAERPKEQPRLDARISVGGVSIGGVF
jgi:hypothetical protein